MSRFHASAPVARLAARLASLVVGAAFVVVLVVSLTNDDPTPAAGMIVLALLALELAACAAAWRWERAGGIAILSGAAALAAALWMSPTAPPDSALHLVVVALYGLPAVLVGLLFVVAGSADHGGRTPR